MSLTVKHLFPFLKLMKALQIREDFKAIVKNKINIEDMTDEDRETLLQERGIDLVFAFMEKMPNAEREIKSFLALYSEKTLEEIEALEVEDFIELIKTFLKEPQLKSFFKQAVK